ncbi:MAG TPA: PKD domain-containing protein, partial [Bacteroidales bacterium]|nr:PKD domain-containing protein [Bacteroidales bacterium]
ENGVVRIEVNPPLSIVAITPSTVCQGDVVSIIANASGGDGNYVYHWSTGLISTDNTLQFSAITSTTLSVFVTDGCNSPADTAVVVINIAPEPEISLTKTPYKGCAPLTVVFDNTTDILTYTYDWDFGDPTSGANNWSDLKQPSHFYETPGTYTITCEVTTNLGCSRTGEVIILVHDSPIADFVAHPWSTGMFDANITFTDATDSAIAWQWDFGDGYTSGEQNPQHTYFTYGLFPVQLVAFSQEGCSDTVVKNVEIIESLLFYVPNAINIRTPGNDEFYPKGSGVDLLSYEMTIFNRWGEEIFHTNDFYARWQGRYNQNKGDYVPQGVYAWIITLKDKWGKDHTFSGNVTVFK